MPLYRFRCENKKCREIESISLSSDVRNDVRSCSICGSSMFRLLSKPLNAIITEKPDKYRGKSVKVNINDELKKRAHEHFVKNEMDDLIQKHGIEHAKSVGWVDPKTGKKRNLIDEK